MNTEKKQITIEQALVDKEIVVAQLKETTTAVISNLIKESFDSSIKDNLKINEAEGDEDPELNDIEVDTEETPEGTEEVIGGEEAIETEPETGDVEVDDINVDDLEAENEPEEEIVDLTSIEDTAKGIEIFRKLTDDDLLDVIKDGQIKVVDPETNQEYLLKPQALTEAFEGEDFFGDVMVDDGDTEIDAILAKYSKPEDDAVVAKALKGKQPEDLDIPQDEEEFEIDLEDEPEEELEETAVMGSHTHQTGRKQHAYTGKGVFPNDRLRPDQKNEAKIVKLEKQVKALTESNEKYQRGTTELVADLKEISKSYTNLVNATRLMFEHSTTKDEKTNMLERFDKCKSIEESNKLYESITKELTESKPKQNVIAEQTKTTKGSLVEKQSYCSDELTEGAMSIMERMEKLDKTKKQQK